MLSCVRTVSHVDPRTSSLSLFLTTGVLQSYSSRPSVGQQSGQATQHNCDRRTRCIQGEGANAAVTSFLPCLCSPKHKKAASTLKRSVVAQTSMVSCAVSFEQCGWAKGEHSTTLRLPFLFTPPPRFFLSSLFPPLLPFLCKTHRYCAGRYRSTHHRVPTATAMVTCRCATGATGCSAGTAGREPG